MDFHKKIITQSPRTLKSGALKSDKESPTGDPGENTEEQIGPGWISIFPVPRLLRFVPILVVSGFTDFSIFHTNTSSQKIYSLCRDL